MTKLEWSHQTQKSDAVANLSKARQRLRIGFTIALIFQGSHSEKTENLFLLKRAEILTQQATSERVPIT
ncbi:MAG: hypothetical protein AAB354_16255 [candidate division KSB1 bacterium]